MTYEDIISRFQVKNRSPGKVQCICPAHDDRQASLTITKCADGKTIMHCHARCKTSDILAAVGLSMKDLFESDPSRPGEGWRSYVEGRENKRIEDVYHYVDLKGDYAFTRLRMFPKDFIYGIMKDNRFSYGLKGRKRKDWPAVFCDSIARLKEAIRDGERIYYSEGEKDVKALISHGRVGITCGGSGDWVPGCAPLFEGADVVILQDNDDAGEKLTGDIIKDIITVAKSVRVVVPTPDLERGDISDYFEKHTIKDLEELVESTPVVKLEKGQPDANGDKVSGQLVTGQDDRRDPELKTKTKKTARGEVEEVCQTISNCVEAIAYDQELYGKLCYNELTFSPYIRGRLPWMSDARPREWNNGDDSFLRRYLEKYGLTSEKKISDGFEIVIRSNPYNPIKDVLMAIRSDRWDGKPGHIRKLLPEYLGCEDTDYNYEVMRLVMIAAVKRIFQPGCKFDLVMVLVGPQGVGKSQFTKTLALYPEWYCDNFNTFEPEKAVAQLRGFWIVEVAEMLATKRAREVESIKAFISSQKDVYREPYRQRTENRPRRCVFIGTTNDEGFLTDKTGNRRFLPIAAGVIKPTKSLFDDSDAVRTDFMNAWGEAFDYYLQDPDQDLILPVAVLNAAEEAQDRYTTDDVRIGMIQRYLDTRLKGYPVCVAELFQEALGNERLPVRHESNELHAIMQNLIPGWRKIDKRVRCDRYGPQWAYEKIREVVPMEQEEFSDLDHEVRNPFELP